MKRAMIAAAVLFLASPAHAQLVVIDPAVLARSITIVQQTYAQYEQLIRQFNTLTEMSARLSGIEAYKLHPVFMGQHDVARYTYGAPLLTGLNSGDARGELYARVISTIPAIAALAETLPFEARRVIQNQVAAVEISDSIMQRSIHQVGALRGFSGSLDTAIRTLEDHVTNPRTAYHYFTAVADKISGAELIGRQQDEANNQLLSHSLEQQILKSKRDRDTEAEVINMHINGMLYGRQAQEALMDGIDEAVSGWRQP